MQLRDILGSDDSSIYDQRNGNITDGFILKHVSLHVFGEKMKKYFSKQ